MFDLNDIINSLENERNKRKSRDFIFASWPEQINMLVESLEDQEEKRKSFNPLTASWTEQLNLMIDYLEIANEDREDIKNKLSALTSVKNYNTQEVDDLLDELIITLKKLKIM